MSIQTTAFLFSLRDRIAGMIGNVLEHYDYALFGLLAPFIAPLFFEEKDPATALILTYGILPLGFLTRPLGSLCFGWMGDRFGRKPALFSSLLGMAIVTVGMGCLPIYREIGIWAPIGLAVGKMLQSFFAAGEVAGGAIFILEKTPVSKRGLISGCYDASTVAGILIASGLVAWLNSQGSLEKNWRLLFWLGGLTAFLGIFLRLTIQERIRFKEKQLSWFQGLKKYRADLVSIILASGFSQTTYVLPFVLMNGYVPLVTSVSKSEMMQMNTILLLLDLLLLPLFGYCAYRLGKEKVMFTAALVSTLTAIPLFCCLDHASFTVVVIVRVAIVVMGVVFAAPYYAWAVERVPPEHRYLMLSFGGALGAQLIGAPASAICLWLHQITGWSGIPGLYLMIAGMGACYAVRRPIRYFANDLISEPFDNSFK